MVDIDVTEKTGYIINDVFKPVTIRDERGIIFYSTESELPEVQQFNLPGFGRFTVDSGNFKKASNPIQYPYMELPPAEHEFPSTKNFQIKFGDNPHKCTINFAKGIILFDSGFKCRPLPQIFYILFHEEGHRFLLTEKYADLYAANAMLTKGFNPYQILHAQHHSLSDKQQYRKDYLRNRMVDAGLIKP